jgi:hypothetical protein
MIFYCAIDVETLYICAFGVFGRYPTTFRVLVKGVGRCATLLTIAWMRCSSHNLVRLMCQRRRGCRAKTLKRWPDLFPSIVVNITLPVDTCLKVLELIKDCIEFGVDI